MFMDGSFSGIIYYFDTCLILHVWPCSLEACFSSMLCAFLISTIIYLWDLAEFADKEMQNPRMAPSSEIQNAKPRKKKAGASRASTIQLQGNDVREVKQVRVPLSLRPGQKAFKKSSKKEGSSLFQQPERSNSDSLPDSSAPVDEYRHLRHRYLLLEEDSFSVGGALSKVEDEVKTLEDEKFALLDQLVVLEGLIDPSKVQPNGF